MIFLVFELYINFFQLENQIAQIFNLFSLVSGFN